MLYTLLVFIAQKYNQYTMNVINNLHTELDKFQLQMLESDQTDATSTDVREIKLQAVIRSFDKPPKVQKLSNILASYDFTDQTSSSDSDTKTEWLVLARATTVVIQSLLEELFARSLPISRDVMYWDSLHASRLWRAIYAIQSMSKPDSYESSHADTMLALPSRVYRFANLLYNHAASQLENQTFTLGTLRRSVFTSTMLRSAAFPHLQKHNNANAARLLSIDTILKQEIMTKRQRLISLRDCQAQAVGLLVTKAHFTVLENLETDVCRLTSLLDYLSVATVIESSLKNDNFEALALDSPKLAPNPSQLARKLVDICATFDTARRSFRGLAKADTKPSRLSRYWAALLIGYLSASSLLEYVSNREQELTVWITEMTETTKSFWYNWIIEPSKKILATIRHDEGSEVALMSRKSLSADMESLERMVVEFARDNPQYAPSMNWGDLKASAREGDLTPVLMAYEDNLKSPLRNAITGSLVRSLLIQVQKTKVDVEVAINGIDKLLKSQELVFGFVGVSPAIVILWVVARWISKSRSKSTTITSGSERLATLRTIHHIERLVTKGQKDDLTSYKKRGLVLCYVQILRASTTCINQELRDQYIEDLCDLEEAETPKQMRAVVKRVIRGYSQNGASIQ